MHDFDRLTIARQRQTDHDQAIALQHGRAVAEGTGTDIVDQYRRCSPYDQEVLATELWKP